MTKKDLKAKCKDILKKYEGGKVIESQTKDFDFLMNVFSSHQSWDIKQGAGIKNITTQRTKYGNYCFMLVRKDGSITDISYIRSIDKPLTNKAKINKACRTAIRPVIKDFRNKNVVFGVTVCPFTDEILTYDNCHIDHYNHQFNVVFNAWMNRNDEKELMKHINNCSKDGCVDVFFTSQEVIDDFVKFHNANTNLRAVSKKANLGFLK